MMTSYQQYEIDDDPGRIDFDTVHGWLSSTYWSPGIERWKVEQAAAHSEVVVGVYLDRAQVGYARVVSDTIRFAYLADVYVDEGHRGRGIAQALLTYVQNHPSLLETPHVTLKTLDAHRVYARAGFEPIPDPENWMRWKRSGASLSDPRSER